MTGRVVAPGPEKESPSSAVGAVWLLLSVLLLVLVFLPIFAG